MSDSRREGRKQYQLELEQRPGYVYAKVKSIVVTRGIALEYLAYVINRCADVSKLGPFPEGAVRDSP